jgi:CheY-like chemotaxis protein
MSFREEVCRALRFLIVDDDELSRELLAILIESEGHLVQLAVSGDEALERLKGSSDQQPGPDVILTDLQMPGLAGAALAAALRTEGGAARILAMSGSQPAAGALEGFDGFLLKPFDMTALNAALAETLPEVFPEADTPELGKPASQADEALVGSAEELSTDRLPALNEVIYGQLAKSMTAVQLGQMYALCLSDARKRIEHMAALAEAGDDEAYRKEAHTVKGGCGLIGATELYRLAETAESNGLDHAVKKPATSSINRIKALLNRLSAACDRLERILGEQR